MSAWTVGDVALMRPMWLMAAIACLAWAALARHRRGDGWTALVPPAVLRFIGGGDRRRVPPTTLLAASLVALALAEPATRNDEAATWRHATAWLIAMDVSRSMTLDDVAPTRLAAARDAVLAVSAHAEARALGLVVFAGDAFLVAPPAFDHTVLESYARRLEYGDVPIDGSNVARALSLVASVIADAQLAAARVFLIGDSGGANRNAIAAARFLADAGHRVDVLQFGRDGIDNGPHGAVDARALERLAVAGGGRAIVADAFGEVELETLALRGDAADLEGLGAAAWTSRSVWLLLPLLLLFPFWLGAPSR